MRWRGVAAAALLVAVASAPAFGYLKLGTRVQTSRTANLKWGDLPIRYFVTNRSENQVTAQQFQTAISRAFATWDAVETAETSSQFAGFTPAPPITGDSMTVLGFASRPWSRPASPAGTTSNRLRSTRSVTCSGSAIPPSAKPS